MAIRAFYGSKLSPNITRSPEGYLICLNVPIARVGWYKYLGREIGLDGEDAEKIIDVYRSPEEVFKDSAIASFQGKSVTNGHPPEGVEVGNNYVYDKGDVLNPRKSDDETYLIADLMIKDPFLIEQIESGAKREVSSGYDCFYVPNEDGTYSQKDIIGNHVAVVDAGRAGDLVRIKDSRAPNLSAFRTPDELAQMIDHKDHNHLTNAEINQALQEGGRFYVMSRVDPKSLKVQDEKSLQGVRDEFDQSKTPPIIVGKDGFVIDGRHRVASAKRCGVNLIDAYVPALKPQTAQDGQNSKVRYSRMSEIKLPRKVGSMTRFLAAIGVKQLAMDAAPEDVMDAIDAMAEEHSQHSENDFPVQTGQPGEGQSAKVGDDEGGQDAISELKAQVAQLTALVQKALAPKEEDPEQALDAEIERLSKEDKDDDDDDDDESKTVEAQDDEGPVSDPEDRPQSAFKATDSAAEFLKAMKPAIAAIKDPIEKKRVVDAALKAVKGRTARPSQTYQKMTKPAKTADTAPKADPSELGKQIMAAHNPHYKNRV